MAATGKKAFDCVEFKRQAQAGVHAEWERQKSDFASYAEFLATDPPEWEREFWAKVRRAGAARPRERHGLTGTLAGSAR